MSTTVLREDLKRRKTAGCLVLIGPVTIRNAFELAIIDRILLENVAKGTLETLSESNLVLLGFMVVATFFTRLTRYGFGLMVRGRTIASRTAGHSARQGLRSRT